MLDYPSGHTPSDRPYEPSAMSDPGFVLKTTPPRMPRAALVRERLVREAEGMFGATAVSVSAPAGFGKTTLLLQWRQRWLEQGARVAWLSADAQDDPVRFAAALLHAVRGIGSIDEADVAGRAGMEAITALLAGIARRRVQVVLVVDDAERLPASTVAQALQYLLLNAPANLHIAIGARAPLSLRTAELLAHDRFRQWTVQALRLLPEESLALLETRLGPALDVDARMRLHEATEGWPIGLQLAIAAIEHEPDPAAAARALSARRGSLQDYFSDSMRAAFDDPTMAALMRIAVPDRFDAELGALARGAPIDGLLRQLATETPILIEADEVGWFRLHPLARDYLLGLFERMPAEERAALHARISHWHACRGHFHEAADHALAAGDAASAREHATRALFALGALGKFGEAQEWLARMPDLLHAEDPQSRLAAAAALALSDRNGEGLRVAAAVIDDATTPPALAVAALRVATGAGLFADDIGLVRDRLAGWPRFSAGEVEPLYLMSRLNIEAFLALHAGDTAHARSTIADAARLGVAGALRLASASGSMIAALAWLRDGNPAAAEAVLRGPLLAAEREEGRRGMVASLLASILAQALVELDRHAEARMLLADRLDVIERQGFPDNILSAYTALVQAALAQGDEARALATLEGLQAVALRRQLPRLRLHALAGLVRLLALKDCHESVAGQLLALDALAGELDGEPARGWQADYRLVAAIARAHGAIASGDLVGADRQLDVAVATATAINRTRDLRIARILRAVVAYRRGDRAAHGILQEAIGLARLSGSARLLADAHPLALRMAADLEHVTFLPDRTGFASPREPVPASALLTPKEAEILGLLERGMSNKRIALTLGIGAETVKWHLKNLFSKLSAGTREHAVDRARLLGLLDA